MNNIFNIFNKRVYQVSQEINNNICGISCIGGICMGMVWARYNYIRFKKYNLGFICESIVGMGIGWLGTALVIKGLGKLPLLPVLIIPTGLFYIANVGYDTICENYWPTNHKAIIPTILPMTQPVVEYLLDANNNTLFNYPKIEFHTDKKYEKYTDNKEKQDIIEALDDLNDLKARRLLRKNKQKEEEEADKKEENDTEENDKKEESMLESIIAYGPVDVSKMSELTGGNK